MPIYMFECPECGGRDEYLLPRMGDVSEGCCRSNCDYEGELKRVYHGSTFAAHTNAANKRSESQRFSKDGLPNHILVPVPEGITPPKGVVGINLETKEIKTYKPDF